MDAMATRLTLQTYVKGAWHDAATVAFAVEQAGHRGATTLDYDVSYCLDRDPAMTGAVNGIDALSVDLPISLGWTKASHWPPFLLDLLPQGHARAQLAGVLGLDPNTDACDLPLLLRAGGSPIGNLRIKEAWRDERSRVGASQHPGLTMDEVLGLDERFLTLAAEFTAIASGSSGVQGAWPKVLLTEARNGRWYPDPMVADEDAVEHVIVKWLGDRLAESQLILASEAPYLELARGFGLRCGRPLRHQRGVLVVPRFDRQVKDGHVTRFGQESLVSAAGVAAFGHEAAHEDYLAVITRVCTDPAAEVTEYVLRDLLNLALGNPDNHGRNTALQKLSDNTIRLTPVYDLCPMRLDPTGIRRSTTWACMKSTTGPSRDLAPDWGVVCEVAADGVMAADDLRATLAAKAPLLDALPARAREIGVADVVIDRAMARCHEMAEAVASLRPGAAHAPA
jgi:serine/threonine-protein kinase HipA